jgi:hypothetical protein
MATIAGSLVSGSLVLMADYSWKSNAELCVGDYVLGADLLPATVTEIKTAEMGNFRRMLSFVENPQFQFTEVNMLWARDHERQWWWTDNVRVLQISWQRGYDVGLKKIDSHLVSYDVEFATLGGFERRTIVDVTEKYSFDTEMIFFKTDRCSPVIVNGYIFPSGINENIYDYTQFNWTDCYTQLSTSLKDIP